MSAAATATTTASISSRSALGWEIRLEQDFAAWGRKGPRHVISFPLPSQTIGTYRIFARIEKLLLMKDCLI